MKQSQLLCKTLKTPPKEAEVISHQLLLRGDFISQLASGVYSFLPLGLRVQAKLENIIREEMNSIGSQEVFLPALQPKEIWLKTGRWEKMDPPLFKLIDRHKKEFALGSTHEEVIVGLVKDRIRSWRDLPLSLYQIQTKFRNEMRFTGGLLRTREFTMKDLYSFHSDPKDLEAFFQKVLKAYDRIFQRCGLDVLKSEASGGVFTKEKTYEFQIISGVGEDKIVFCPSCKWAANLEVFSLEGNKKCPNCKKEIKEEKAIELGHTFRLGAKYSEAFDFYFLDKHGKRQKVIMGCYGIGVGRLMAAIVEIYNDKKGILWPREVAPFQIHLIQIEESRKVREASGRLYGILQKAGIEVLYDDRIDKTVGQKFADSDLIGIPLRVVVSEKTLKKNSIEIKERNRDAIRLIKLSQAPKILIA